MTPARNRHPALARKLDGLTAERRADRKALSYLLAETNESAEFRGHRHLITEYFSDTHARLTCPYCGADADANTKPAANGIDIGGSLVAINCEETTG